MFKCQLDAERIKQNNKIIINHLRKHDRQGNLSQEQSSFSKYLSAFLLSLEVSFLQKGNKMIIIWDWDELSIHQRVCLMWYTCTNGMCFLIRELFSRQEKIHFLNKNILHPRYGFLQNLMSFEADITAIKIWVKE